MCKSMPEGKRKTLSVTFGTKGLIESILLLFQNQSIIFTAFLVFEACVGVFWPSIGTMRGKYVPEASTYISNYSIGCFLLFS